MDNKTDVRQGRLALMVLKTLESLGPLQGYGSTHFGALVRIVVLFADVRGALAGKRQSGSEGSVRGMSVDAR